MGLVVMRDNSESKACMFLYMYVFLCVACRSSVRTLQRVLGVSWSFNGESQVGWRP